MPKKKRQQRHHRSHADTPVPTAQKPVQYMDQEVGGGWKVLLPGTGIYYSDYVPPEQRPPSTFVPTQHS